MTNPNLEALLARLRALRAKAEDPNITEAEASLYAAKVAELLQKYNLEEMHLNKTDEEIFVQERFVHDYLNDEWRQYICGFTAQLYFCKFLHVKNFDNIPKQRTEGIFCGRSHNISVAVQMSEYLISAVIRLGKQWRSEQAKCSHSEFAMFLRACGYRVANRVSKLCTDAMQPNGDGSALPVLYRTEAEHLQEWVKQEINPNKASKQRQLLEGRAAHAGLAAGDTVSLNTQIGTTRAAGRLLQ